MQPQINIAIVSKMLYNFVKNKQKTPFKYLNQSRR